MHLLDSRGNPIPQQRSINLDPSFFTVGFGGAGNFTSSEVEATPYALHAWTHACAWVIARNISQLPLRLVQRETRETVEDSYGILKLFGAPNPLMSYTPFIQHIVLALLLQDRRGNSGGQCFIVPRSAKVDNGGKVNLRKKEIPDVLLPFSGKYFTPSVRDAAGGLKQLDGWQFATEDKTGNPIVYLTNEIMRIYFVNPGDWLTGLSSYTPAQLAVLQDIKSDIYNNKLYDNNATPAGVLKTEMVVPEEQAQRIIESWNAKFAGTQNAGKTAILQKGLEYQRIALTNQDIQFTEGKKIALEQIVASFGLNKIALGLYEEVNYATIVEGRRILWNDTYLPIAKNIVEAINSQWIQYVDYKIELEFNTSGVDALQIDYTKKAESMGKMVAAGLPPSMAMRINGIPYTEQDVADYPWLNERQSNGAPMPSESTGTAPAAASRAIRETDTERFSIDYIQRVLIPGEKEWARKMDRFFISQRNRMQDNVDALLMGETKSLVTKQTFKGVSVEAILLSVADENKSLKQIFSPLIKMQLLRSEAKLKEELGGLVQWHVTDPLVDMYVANRKSEIESINTTTMQMAGKKIGIAVEESIAEGETTAQAAKRIKAAIADVGEIRRNQSVMIARTETGIVTNESRFDAMNAEGIEYMEWITAADDKVRHTHLEAGQAGAVRVGENFPGVNMPYPLYSFGDPGEIINCRCVAVAIEKE